MSTPILVNGKTETRPGVYATIKSGIQNPPLNLSYGNVCIIDTGVGASYGGGSGVSGVLKQGIDSVVSFDTPQDMQGFMKGGILWDLAQPLFRPTKRLGARGASRVFYIRAAATTQASCTLTFTAGSAVFKAKDEGLNANGALVSTILRKGYALKFVAGTIDSAKFKVEFWAGTYKGVDALNNTPYDGMIEADSEPVKILQSPEIATLAELSTWITNNPLFDAGFEVVVTGTAALVAGDLVTNAGFIVFAGATETYNATHTDSAILATKDLDCTFYLVGDYGANATSLNNTKISTFLTSGGLKYEKFMIVAGGLDSTTFKTNVAGTSEYAAKYYDTDRVSVVHGGMYKFGKDGSTLLKKSQLYKAAMYLGRVCGLEPQTPVTMKELDIAKEVHILTEADQEYALSVGVVYTYNDNELAAFVVGQGITSLQNNDYLVNEDGSSHDLAVKRITSQLNKELILNAKRTFFGKNVGPNRATITEEDIKAWLAGFLQTKVASTNTDNLIIRYGNISVEVVADTYKVNYEFVPNFPVNKIVFTGIILDK